MSDLDAMLMRLRAETADPRLDGMDQPVMDALARRLETRVARRSYVIAFCVATLVGAGFGALPMARDDTAGLALSGIARTAPSRLLAG